MGRIALDGEHIGLNDDPLPRPFAWSALAADLGTDPGELPPGHPATSAPPPAPGEDAPRQGPPAAGYLDAALELDSVDIEIVPPTSAPSRDLPELAAAPAHLGEPGSFELPAALRDPMAGQPFLRAPPESMEPSTAAREDRAG